jgi:TatD DNase family protein
VFETALQIATQAGGRILTIHSRRAATEVVDMLGRYPSAGTFVLHWYSGNQRDLQRAVDLGCWFSVGPAMMAGKNGRSIVERIPRDRILTESDGPFAQIDGRPAKPWDVGGAETVLADSWHITQAEVRQMIQENLEGLIKQNVTVPQVAPMH